MTEYCKRLDLVLICCIFQYTPPAKSYGRFFFKIVFHTPVTHSNTIIRSYVLDHRYVSIYEL